VCAPGGQRQTNALDLPRVRSRPQQSGVMQETSNLRASSLYSLAWVRDSDKPPHSARGQDVDVRRMISARLRVPPLWCRVRGATTRSTREDLSAQSTNRCLQRTPTPGWIPAPALCVGVGVGVGAAVEGSGQVLVQVEG
jgi:hypothetical protein